MTLHHVVSAAGWARLQADEAWAPAPFWHLCTAGQLDFVLANHFAGQAHVVVLHLDPAQLTELRWETSEPGQDPFPHLYGPLRAAAVLSVSLLSVSARA